MSIPFPDASSLAHGFAFVARFAGGAFLFEATSDKPRSPGKRSAPGVGVTGPRVRFAYPGYKGNQTWFQLSLG